MFATATLHKPSGISGAAQRHNWPNRTQRWDAFLLFTWLTGARFRVQTPRRTRGALVITECLCPCEAHLDGPGVAWWLASMGPLHPHLVRTWLLFPSLHLSGEGSSICVSPTKEGKTGQPDRQDPHMGNVFVGSIRTHHRS